MKKLLIFLMIAALSVSCFIGCGSSEPAEAETAAPTEATEAPAPEATEAVEEEVVEEYEDEYEEEEIGDPVVMPTVVTVLDPITGVSADVTFNGSLYTLFDENPEFPGFAPEGSEDAFLAYEEFVFEEYPDFEEFPLVNGMIMFWADSTVQDFYDARYNANHDPYYESSADVTEITTLEADAGTLYTFDEFWTSDNSVLYKYVIVEKEFGIVIFQIADVADMDVLQVAFNHFFVDVTLAG